MKDQVRHALANDLVIDITTIGRKTGQARRIEIWFHNVNGQIYITGSPGTRGWYANLVDNPNFAFHLKQSAEIDLQAKARPITDATEKRMVLSKILDKIKDNFSDKSPDIDTWVEKSPLVEVTLELD